MPGAEKGRRWAKKIGNSHPANDAISPGIMASAFWHDARLYIGAAKILIDNEAASHIGLKPTYFLLTHALELTFKAYLAAREWDYDRLLRLSHDVQRAYTKARGLGLRIEGEHSQRLIRILSEFHRMHVFRYSPVTDDGSVIEPGALVPASDVFNLVADIHRRIQAPVFAARFKDVKGKTYSVETWHMGNPSKP